MLTSSTNRTQWIEIKSDGAFLFSCTYVFTKCFNYHTKGHSLCKPCLHDLQFMKTMSSSPNLSNLARAGISCQFMKTRSLCRHCLQNEWTLQIFLHCTVQTPPPVTFELEISRRHHKPLIFESIIKGMLGPKAVDIKFCLFVTEEILYSITAGSIPRS